MSESLKVVCIVVDNCLIFLKCQSKFSIQKNLYNIFTEVGQVVALQRWL